MGQVMDYSIKRTDDEGKATFWTEGVGLRTGKESAQVWPSQRAAIDAAETVCTGEALTVIVVDENDQEVFIMQTPRTK